MHNRPTKYRPDSSLGMAEDSSQTPQPDDFPGGRNGMRGSAASATTAATTTSSSHGRSSIESSSSPSFLSRPSTASTRNGAVVDEETMAQAVERLFCILQVR